MYDPKQTVIGFVSGKLSPAEFVKECKSDPKIIKWIQSIVPEGKTCYKDTKEIEPDGYIKYGQEVVPYDFGLILDQHLCSGGEITGKYLNIHVDLSNLLKEVFPNEDIFYSDAIKKKFLFMLDSCPEYIGGPDIENTHIIDGLYDNLPENISNSKQISLFKTQLKDIFHITDKKYPKWIQGAEWPMGKNSPMKFTGQKIKCKGETVAYTFEDVDTGELREIIQYY